MQLAGPRKEWISPTKVPAATQIDVSDNEADDLNHERAEVPEGEAQQQGPCCKRSKLNPAPPHVDADAFVYTEYSVQSH